MDFVGNIILLVSALTLFAITNEKITNVAKTIEECNLREEEKNRNLMSLDVISKATMYVTIITIIVIVIKIMASGK